MAHVVKSRGPLPTPPDGGWGWVVVFASFMIHIVTDGVTYSFGVLYVEFLSYFQEGKGATAWIASILVGVTLCSGPISSAFVNRYGCRAVTIAGAILASICMALSVFATNVIFLYFSIGVGTGFGFGLIYLPAIVSVTCYFEKYRSLATGIAVCGSGLGTFIFAPFTDFLIKELSWKGALLVIACFVLACTLLGALFRPLQPDPEDVCNEVELEGGTELVPMDKRQNTSEHNIQQAVVNGGIHRPHSISHFNIPGKPGRSPNTRRVMATSDTSRLALSQPALLSYSTSRMYGSQNLRNKSSGVMYRKDVFYRGSAHNIPHHRSVPWLPNESKLSEEMQMMPVNGHVEPEMLPLEERALLCGLVPCSPETKDILTEMLDLSLLKDPIFILFTISNFLTSIGFNMPYVYIVAQATERGISNVMASYLLAVIGIANLIGRIILGYLSDKPWVNRLLVYNVCLTICGLGTALSALCYDFISFAFYASLFGFTIGAYVGLTSVILVDLLGLDKLTNAFGLLLLFQGIASLIGPPIGGFLFDFLGSYDYAFYVAGVTIALSGIMLFCIPCVQRRLARRDTKCMNGISKTTVIGS